MLKAETGVLEVRQLLKGSEQMLVNWEKSREPRGGCRGDEATLGRCDESTGLSEIIAGLRGNVCRRCWKRGR